MNASEKIAQRKSRSKKSKTVPPEDGEDDGGGCAGRLRVNRKMIPLKITLFLFFGSMSAILPYLTIHMKDIGISLSQIGIIYAVLPLTAFMGQPIMGALADKIGNYKIVLVVATIINGVAHTLLLLVPKYSESMVTAPAVIEFNSGAYYGIPTIVMMRPLQTSHCLQFTKSLEAGGGNNDDNNAMNIHSCKWGDGGNESNPLASSVVRRWRIPNLCRRQKQSSSYGNGVPEFNCENDMVDLASQFGGSRSGRIPLSIGPTPGADSKCSFPVLLNGVVGQGVQQLVTCRTNYTFPTGEVQKNGSRSLTFWLYFLIRVISNMFMNSCYSLLDATTLAMVKANKGSEFGIQRIFTVLGPAISSPLAGLLVDTVSASKGSVDYAPAFYMADALLCLNVLAYVFMKLEVEKPGDDMKKNAVKLLRYPDVIVFLAMIFVMGNMWGFIESYLFIFLDELSAPKYLLGLTMTVGCITSLPLLFWAKWIVRVVGRVNIIVFAFLVYFIRLLGYSFIPSPFWCFPFEAMEAITLHLMWVAAATYCGILAPKGLLGTLTGVMGSLHYGLGKGSGAFIGGYVIGASSTRLAFRYYGIFAGSIGVIYFLLHTFWLKAAALKRNEREQEKDSKGQLENMLHDEDQVA